MPVEMSDYRVVAVDGEGVFVADDDGNCWHVGGPHPDADGDNKLVRDYRAAVDDGR